ncbi:SET domain-containing protein-lysine N-methyltransferase [archaeon]|nr:MAG: SET domain-containing protein-lysine N-methyltransferase [archaeon]
MASLVRESEAGVGVRAVLPDAAATAPPAAVPPTTCSRAESYAVWRKRTELQRQHAAAARTVEEAVVTMPQSSNMHVDLGIPADAALPHEPIVANNVQGLRARLAQTPLQAVRMKVWDPSRPPPSWIWSSVADCEARARYNTRRLMLGRSRIDGTGLYVTQDIEMDDVIAEYTGEIINDEVCEARERYYEAHKVADYMFRVGPNEIVDATTRGCRARYINHSCDPNCFAVIALPGDSALAAYEGEDALEENGRAAAGGAGGAETGAVGSDAATEMGPAKPGLYPPGSQIPLSQRSGRRVFVYAARRILKGEELTYDYQFPADERMIPCRCGAANCRGTLNKQD